MQGDYISKLKEFASDVKGELTYDQHPTKTLNQAGWSRLTIRITHPKAPLYFIAFSGTSSAEVYSGFYAPAKLPANIHCKITQQDSFVRFLNRFKKNQMSSGRPTFDKQLSISCNNKQFLDKLTTDHEIAKFLEKTIRFPIRFEVKPIDKNILASNHNERSMITINSNEWIVDSKKLQTLLSGFTKIANRFC